MELNATTSLNTNTLSHSAPWSVTFVILYVLIFLAGLIGNGLLVLVIYCKQEMRNVTNFFIFNLAVADLLVTIFCIPPTLAATIFTPWMMGSAMCKVMPYIQNVSVCASAYSLVAITLNRCRGLHRPMRRGQGFSIYKAHIIISIIWIVAFSIASPCLFAFQLIPYDDGDLGPFCVEIWQDPVHGQLYFAIFILFGCFCLPLLLISISNMLIWNKVSRRQLPADAASPKAISDLHKTTKLEVKRMLSLVILAFLFCWLLLYAIATRLKLFSYITLGNKETEVLNVLIPLGQLLGSFNSCVNPIIYAFVNTKFRQNFQSLISCRQQQSSHSAHLRCVSYKRNNTVFIESPVIRESSFSSATTFQGFLNLQQGKDTLDIFINGCNDGSKNGYLGNFDAP